jgi:hypothetical protein
MSTKLFVDYYEKLRIYSRYLMGKALTRAIRCAVVDVTLFVNELRRVLQRDEFSRWITRKETPVFALLFAAL